MLPLAYLIAALIVIAATIAVWLLAGWIARLLTWDKCWRVVWFWLIFAVLMILTFAALGWLVANDSVLHTIRMPL